MKRILAILATLAATGGALAALPTQAPALTYNYGGAGCNWATPWDGVYWRWSPYYSVWYVYSYAGGGWWYYRVQNYYGTWRDTWAFPSGC